MSLHSVRHRRRRGMTLMEIVLTMLIVLISVVGLSGLRYHTIRHAHQADLQATGNRLALMLLESWRGNDGGAGFNPGSVLVAPIMVSSAGNGPAAPSGMTVQGYYQVTADNTSYFATLSWKDIAAGYRELHVQVAWDPHDYGSASLSDADKEYALTGYVKY